MNTIYSEGNGISVKECEYWSSYSQYPGIQITISEDDRPDTSIIFSDAEKLNQFIKYLNVYKQVLELKQAM